MFIELLFAVVGLWFLLWPELARHTFVTVRALGIYPPRAVFVRLVGVALLIIALLLLIRPST
jgi:hypothetical protein